MCRTTRLRSDRPMSAPLKRKHRGPSPKTGLDQLGSRCLGLLCACHMDCRDVVEDSLLGWEEGSFVVHELSWSYVGWAVQTQVAYSSLLTILVHAGLLRKLETSDQESWHGLRRARQGLEGSLFLILGRSLSLAWSGGEGIDGTFRLLPGVDAYKAYGVVAVTRAMMRISCLPFCFLIKKKDDEEGDIEKKGEEEEEVAAIEEDEEAIMVKLPIILSLKEKEVILRPIRRKGGISFGVCLGFSSSAEASMGNNKNNEHNKSRLSHGKKVHNDYSITGIPGDGRCLFRSLAHGACARAGKPVPNEALQVELADELRAMVADEFIKRREDTEWFIEGNFDDYVAHIRKPHVWGGEPELLMASHCMSFITVNLEKADACRLLHADFNIDNTNFAVFSMPITVYIHDHEAGGIIAIAEYGQEYGKEDPIRVLYHGFGHYDALQIPGKKTANSRL
ncbi:OTU domain-containing protein [Apostasia shenzhenica]|uniref:Ubiquitin thioesterase OTU n=1 Tax=Apostasia shenzhenica TaxID=1088818 RepID=A0A2I0AAW6_9ASPA|nr:OTU domain-containing protein [Apostasia shenzhenica]